VVKVIQLPILPLFSFLFPLSLSLCNYFIILFLELLSSPLSSFSYFPLVCLGSRLIIFINSPPYDTNLSISDVCLDGGEVAGIVIGCFLAILIIVLLIVLLICLVRRRGGKCACVITDMLLVYYLAEKHLNWLLMISLSAQAHFLTIR